MSAWYKSTKGRIGRHKAIVHSTTGELCIVGRYGEIWVHSDTHFAAVITSARISKKHLPKASHPVQAGDETLIRFPIADLTKWTKILRIVRSRELMIELVDKFGGMDAKT
jgi:hypothetical protein